MFLHPNGSAIMSNIPNSLFVVLTREDKNDPWWPFSVHEERDAARRSSGAIREDSRIQVKIKAYRRPEPELVVESAEYLPCPFCGAAVTRRELLPLIIIHCPCCDIRLTFLDDSQAAKIWNARPVVVRLELEPEPEPEHWLYSQQCPECSQPANGYKWGVETGGAFRCLSGHEWSPTS